MLSVILKDQSVLRCFPPLVIFCFQSHPVFCCGRETGVKGGLEISRIPPFHLWGVSLSTAA